MANTKNGIRRCKTCSRFGCECAAASKRRDVRKEYVFKQKKVK